MPKRALTCSDGSIALTHDALQIDVEDFEDIKSGYKITFTFRENPYFKNQKLVKELHYADDNALAVQGTDIEWTEEGVGPLHLAATDPSLTCSYHRAASSIMLTTA